VTQFLPGQYDWLEGKNKPAQVQITADGKIKGVPPGAQDGTWKVTDSGLDVTVGKETWLFKPGPMHTLMGIYKTTATGVVKRSAMMRPKVLPDEAAYQAALKKLKEAAKQKEKTAQAAAAEANKPLARAVQSGTGPSSVPSSPQGASNGSLYQKLAKPVTLSTPYPQTYKGAPTDRIPLEYAVIELARQAGLRYNWNASYKNTNPVCCNWMTPDIHNVPFGQAMDSLLGPKGLAYDVVNGQIVLRRK
jgi:hypothetical protein